MSRKCILCIIGILKGYLILECAHGPKKATFFSHVESGKMKGTTSGR
jgi:hypothetical protein